MTFSAASKRDRIKMAAVNFRPIYGDKAATLCKIESVIEEAAAQGCDLVVLPEMALNSWFNCASCKVIDGPCATHLSEGEYRDGRLVAGLVELVARLKIHAVVGFLERDRDAPVLYNSAAFIGPDGPIGIYRKMHLGVGAFTEGHTCRPGGELGLYETEFGPVGIGICFDIWMNPELPRIMALKGARLIIAPTAGLKAHDRSGADLTAMAFTRARENVAFVAMANLVGRPGDQDDSLFAGQSVIVGPRYPLMAEVLAEAGEEEGMAVATVDFSQYEKFEELFPWRDWRTNRHAGASHLIAREYEALARIGSATVG